VLNNYYLLLRILNIILKTTGRKAILQNEKRRQGNDLVSTWQEIDAD
jgi:hypothetical protein